MTKRVVQRDLHDAKRPFPMLCVCMWVCSRPRTIRARANVYDLHAEGQVLREGRRAREGEGLGYQRELADAAEWVRGRI